MNKDFYLDMYFESLMDESVNANDMNEISEVVIESVFEKGPMKKFREKINIIVKSRPDDLSDESEAQKYIEDHYDTLMKASSVLEKEPDELKKGDYNLVKNTIIIALVGIATVPILGQAATIVVLLGIAYAGVQFMINYARLMDDDKVYNDLKKVKKSLDKVVKNDKLSNTAKKKIQKMIDSIDDAIESYNGAGDKASVSKNLFDTTSKFKTH